MVELHTERLTKRFGLRAIFSDLSFELTAGDSLAVTGRNGSGKSTLLKLLANVAEPTSGAVRWRVAGAALDATTLPANLGFVAPYLQLYAEFTAWEHVEMMQQMRALPFDEGRALELFERFGLAARRNEPIGAYSSGMLQRVKFICALVHRPAFLFLDEPMTNLDVQGIAAMRELVLESRESRVTVVATNEEEDLRLCTKQLALGRNDDA